MMSNIELNRKREQQILLSLNKLDYLSTSQLQRLHNLGGHRNACRVLKNMEQYLSSFRDKEKIYYLNKEGRERVGSDKIRKKLNNGKVIHYMIRNDFYIYRNPKKWRPEQAVKVGGLRLVPDAVFSVPVLAEEKYFFLEVDNTQYMKNNKKKIDNYKRLLNTGAFQKDFGYFPMLVWVTKYDARKKELMKMCNGMKAEIYTWDEIK